MTTLILDLVDGPQEDVTSTTGKIKDPLDRQEMPEQQFGRGGLYSGQWAGNYRDGMGLMKWPSGAKYIGEFRSGTISGQGTLTTPNGVTYKGDFMNDVAHHQGLCYNKAGVYYIGGWKDAKKHGDGYENHPDGTQFHGLYSNGEMDDGSFSWPDGSTYCGQFLGGMADGDGTHKECNGRTYIGQFKGNKRHGHGTFLFPDGRVYDGQYANNDKCGKGVMSWPTGCRYEGQWSAGKQHGFGFMVSEYGEKRVNTVWRMGQMIQEVADEVEAASLMGCLPAEVNHDETRDCQFPAEANNGVMEEHTSLSYGEYDPGKLDGISYEIHEHEWREKYSAGWYRNEECEEWDADAAEGQPNPSIGVQIQACAHEQLEDEAIDDVSERVSFGFPACNRGEFGEEGEWLRQAGIDGAHRLFEAGVHEEFDEDDAGDISEMLSPGHQHLARAGETNWSENEFSANMSHFDPPPRSMAMPTVAMEDSSVNKELLIATGSLQRIGQRR